MINPRPPYSNELYHYGVKGMKWGIRRYQPYPKGYSGKGRYLGSHIGKLNANRIVEKHLANTLTEDQLKRRRNLSIAGAAAGLGGTGLGIYSILSGKKANPAIKDIRYKRANANLVRGGKAAIGTGLGFTAVSAMEAKKYANALKYKKRHIGAIPEGYEKFQPWGHDEYFIRKEGPNVGDDGVSVHDKKKYAKALNSTRLRENQQLARKSVLPTAAITAGGAGLYMLGKKMNSQSLKRKGLVNAGLGGLMTASTLYVGYKDKKRNEREELSEWQKHDKSMMRYKGDLYRKKRRK